MRSNRTMYTTLAEGMQRANAMAMDIHRRGLQPPLPPPPPPPHPAAKSDDQHALSDELSRLADLHRAGSLDDDEFRAAKRRVLFGPSSMPAHPAVAGGTDMAGSAVPFADQVVSIKDFGALGDSTSDDTDAIQAAIDDANNRSASVFIPSGVFVITRPLNVTAPCYGETASTSVIANRGDGDAFIVMTGYHSFFRDFKVQGDCEDVPPATACRTRDGIVLMINKSYGLLRQTSLDHVSFPIHRRIWRSRYMRFQNVVAEYHGRHGLHQRADWATSWTNSSE